jgi:hypothetical protein
MNDWSVNIVDYTNASGTHDVMKGTDEFAYAVMALAAIEAGKTDFTTVTSDDVRSFLQKIDAANTGFNSETGKPNNSYAGQFDKHDVISYLAPKVFNEAAQVVGYDELIQFMDKFGYEPYELAEYEAYNKFRNAHMDLTEIYVHSLNSAASTTNQSGYNVFEDFKDYAPAMEALKTEDEVMSE